MEFPLLCEMDTKEMKMNCINLINKLTRFNRIFIILILWLLSSASDSICQPPNVERWYSIPLARSKVWLTVSNSLRIGPVDNPWRGYSLDYPGYPVGADASDHYSYLASGGYLIYGERDGTPAAYTITGRFGTSSRYASPVRTTKRLKNWNLLDPKIPAEEVITGAHHVRDLDVDVGMKSMAWSYPPYDDFIIHEYTIINTGSTRLDNLHFGKRYDVWATLKGDYIGPGSDADDKYGWDEQHECFYFYDDWSFNWDSEIPYQFNFGPGPETGDIGDPADIAGGLSYTHELYSTAYFAFLILDAAGGTIFQNIQQYIGQGTSTDAPLEDSPVRLGTDPAERFLEVITHQQPRMSWDEAKALSGEGGNKYERMPEMVLSCGPYNLEPGDSVTVVFADVFGEMNREKIVEGGADNVRLLATESKAALMANIDAVKQLYQDDYQPLNYPPPAPTDTLNTLGLVSIAGGIEISFPPVPDTYSDPETGINDFAGYKIYRSAYSYTGPWTLAGSIQKEDVIVEDGMVIYLDLDLPFGVGNYYTVTSYDTDDNESGKVNWSLYPVYPIRSPNPDLTKHKVYVVPNPFRQHSGLFGKGEELRIEFMNIPAICTIRIYTLAGEIVQVIEHDDGSGSEAWGSIEKLDYQVNQWMLYVAPGVYIYHVESKVPGQEGKYYIGKFSIIK
jgi:hypothetical protein